MNTLLNGSLRGEEAASPDNAEIALDIIPEAVNSQKGVSVRYVKTPDNDWYVLRVSYGREVKARDMLIDMGIYAHVAQRYEMKEIGGKRRKVLVSLLPNLLFAYLPKTSADFYVKGPSILSGRDDQYQTNALALSSLVSFYYNHFEKAVYDAGKNPPLTIADREMISFIRATSTMSEHLKEKCRILNDKMVEVIRGDYKGVKGRMARVAGQQCIVVSLANGKWNISTEYIPTPYIRVLE